MKVLIDMFAGHIRQVLVRLLLRRFDESPGSLRKMSPSSIFMTTLNAHQSVLFYLHNEGAFKLNFIITGGPFYSFGTLPKHASFLVIFSL